MVELGLDYLGVGGGVGNLVTDAVNDNIHSVDDALKSFALSALAFASIGALLAKPVEKLASTGIASSAVNFPHGIIGKLGSRDAATARRTKDLLIFE